MPSFDIVKKLEVNDSFRVSKIKSDFDFSENHVVEHFKGEINIPEKWQIGLIFGNSGTGKSTIAKELFGDILINGFEYKAKSVIDDMPENVSVEDIEKMFCAVGFSSVPSWLKPYSVLSNGEKMRVDIARALLTYDIIAFDEFTSVVDRNVAKVACIAINKAIRKNPDKKFIAITCHEDVLEYLQPDWAFCTNDMKNFFQSAHDLKKDLKSDNAIKGCGQNLGVIII